MKVGPTNLTPYTNHAFLEQHKSIRLHIPFHILLQLSFQLTIHEQTHYDKQTQLRVFYLMVQLTLIDMFYVLVVYSLFQDRIFS
jgi:hypothetical protein